MRGDETRVLRAEGLRIGYPPRRGAAKALSSSLDLSLQPGQFVCLLGPNGVGKSTLIRTLAGMHPPLQGRVTLGNTELREMSPRLKARSISVVLTDSLPVGLFTGYSIVALGRHPHTSWTGSLSSHDEERIRWAMSAVDAESLADRQIAELSDGERQKVMIARALAQETGIILLDEPTAFLDLPRRVDLMRTLRGLALREGLAILLSTHDLDLALRSADQLWLFDRSGKVVSGIPEALALDGSIAGAFQSHELDWDAELGSFRMHRDACVSIAFQGSGTVAAWTRRALLRIGYGIEGSVATAPLSLVVEERDDGSLWRLRGRAGEEQFASLEKLLRRLSSGDDSITRRGGRALK